MSRSTTFPFDRVRPIMLRIIVGALIAAAAVSIISIAVGSFGETSWRFIGATLLFVVFALCSWYDAAVSSRRNAVFALASMATSLAVFAIGIYKIWFETSPETDYSLFSGFPGWILIAIVTRIALLHVHLVLSTEARFVSPVIAAVTKVTIVLVTVFSLGLCLPLLVPQLTLGAAYWEVIAIIAILNALGTVLIPLGFALFAHGTLVSAAKVSGAPVSDTPPLGAVQLGAVQLATYHPPAAAYAQPGAALQLSWPRYTDGRELPATSTGAPDFTGVVGYSDWLAG